MSHKSLADKFLDNIKKNDNNFNIDYSEVKIYGEIIYWETWLILKPNHPIARKELDKIIKKYNL